MPGNEDTLIRISGSWFKFQSGTGALDDPETLRAAELMASEIESAQKVILSNSVHLPNMESPQMFNQAAPSFLGGPNRG